MEDGGLSFRNFYITRSWEEEQWGPGWLRSHLWQDPGSKIKFLADFFSGKQRPQGIARATAHARLGPHGVRGSPGVPKGPLGGFKGPLGPPGPKLEVLLRGGRAGYNGRLNKGIGTFVSRKNSATCPSGYPAEDLSPKEVALGVIQPSE